MVSEAANMKGDRKVSRERIPGGVAYEAFKRLFDILVAASAIIVLSPALLVISIAVKLSSPGPVFYRGLRSGRDGSTFRIWKFRSMVVGAEGGAGTTSRCDSRVTSVGRFIRRYKLDELPQLINVLIGDMSLVGPRPELPRYTAQYRGDELLVLQVRPGITDFSSIEFSNLNDLVSDERPDGDFEEFILPQKNRLRVQYVLERGIGTDMRILGATIVKLLWQR